MASTTTDTSGDVVTSSQLSSGKGNTEYHCTFYAISISVPEIQCEIKGFHRRFNSMKMKTVEFLEKFGIAVKTVVFLLTSIFAVTGEHKMFLKENHKSLRQCEDHQELFGMLNFYWNYLSPDLLDKLLEELIQKESSFEAIGEEMRNYKADLQKFRQRTTLKLFCQADTFSTECDPPPPEFRKMVVTHEWTDTVTLEDVEKFRQRYARTYNLQTCAIMLYSVRRGSFTVTWFVPVTVIHILRKNTALEVYKEFDVSKLEIYYVQETAICVYQTPVQQLVSFI